MPRTLQPYNHRNYLLDKELLRHADLCTGTFIHDDNLERVREVLAQRYGSHSRIRPYDAADNQIRAVFLRALSTARERVPDYEKTRLQSEPISFASVRTPYELTIEGLIHQEQQYPQDPEGLSERIAIMLDSCSVEELTRLTHTCGKNSLGLYAH